MKRLVTHIVLVLAIICGLSAVPHAIAKFASESLSPKERIEVFETIWKTINEDYYDPEFHGIDWALVRERYLPRVEAAKPIRLHWMSLFLAVGETCLVCSDRGQWFRRDGLR